jgi:Cu+-exporting ATPase
LGLLIKKARELGYDYVATGHYARLEQEILNSKSEILKLAASIEKGSEHSLAEAIVKAAESRRLVLNELKEFRAIPGHGVEGTLYDSRSTFHVLFGNRKLMKKEKIDISKSEREIEKLEKEGKTVMILTLRQAQGNQSQLAGIVAVADTIKDTAKEAITELKKMNINSYMVTGDNERTAHAIARQLGIDTKHVFAEVLPEEKENIVKKLKHPIIQSSNKPTNQVAFVGDGINDAPALAASDVGIAMGSGTDVAMEAAGITLINKDLRSVANAINLSKKTMRTIKLNLFWAFAYNVVLIPVAMLGKINPIFASLAMALSSVSVVTNSLFLKRQKI